MSGDGDSPQGRRTLAAIVFTDVAGFSARVQDDEDRTLRLVKRDFDFMKKICGRAGGQVLKSTGDGLLMFFSSAVQAVTCALEIQRSFARAARKLPADQLLQHRIGIHLGDVFVDGADVMGDGVNIAARIQGEAEPGGICISQTVYDVVKNRVGVRTTYLGPRDLKNIREAVPVYSVLLAAQEKVPAEAAAVPGKRRRTLAWIGAGVVAAAALGVGAWFLFGPGGGGSPAQTPEAGNAQGPRGGATRPAKPDPEAERLALLKVYDFDGLVAWARRNPGLAKSLKGTDMAPHYEQMASLVKWVRKEIKTRTQERPLVLDLPKRAGGKGVERTEVWGTADGRFVFKRAGMVRKGTLADVKPPMLAIVMLDLINAAPDGAATRKRELREALMVFVRQYRFSGMLTFREILEARGLPMRPRPGRRPGAPGRPD